MRRSLVSAALLSGCLTLDPFYFGNVPVDEYGWDDDPCDPLLLGELTEAEHELEGGPEPSCHPSRIPAEARTEDFVDADGLAIHYVFAAREDAIATIFYSHGTGRHIGRYWDRVELMWELGFNVMIYDYPGYGRSEGEPSEEGVYTAAEAALSVLADMPGVDPERVFFFGYSLGGAPTYEMALRASRGEVDIVPRGVASEATFCSTEALIEDGARLDLPLEFLGTYAFDNCGKIGKLDASIPILIMHGTGDTFVVPTHARRLRDAAGRNVGFEMFDGADHSQVPVAGGDDYDQALVDFFSQ